MYILSTINYFYIIDLATDDYVDDHTTKQVINLAADSKNVNLSQSFLQESVDSFGLASIPK